MKRFLKTDLAVRVAIGLVACMIILAELFPVHKAQATDFPLAMRGNTLALTILTAPAAATTNAIGSAVFVEGVLYHTFQGVNSGAAQQFAIDRSLDGINWVIVSTNSVGGTNTADTAFSGKYSYLRARQLGTNSALSVLYLGETKPVFWLGFIVGAVAAAMVLVLVFCFYALRSNGGCNRKIV